ncbi:alanine/glycine:cation symporter family protein [Solibacillus silvestris]|uniref:alanine/glycine:cation symporter family protein n=1 Tax=Solibacillus silvestris TaxID=76853 RepID=UPI003F7D18BD
MNKYIWSNALVFLFLAVGVIFTFRTKFVQIRRFKDMIMLLFEKNYDNAGISSFQALAMSLGSRIGTGNIIGVATAISLGGPGAVFWMWVMGFLGAATSFIEITLSQIYKSKIEGEYRGGTPFYIYKGLNLKWFSVISAIILIVVIGILWPTVQANTIALTVQESFNVPLVVTGILLASLMAGIIYGGVKRIATVSEYLVPFMALAYVAICIVLLAVNISEVPAMFSLIVSSALNLNATFAGLFGTAIAMGVQRGVFSSAAGLGTETFESGATSVSHPAKQGLVQAFSIYIDTFLICTATAFMILITGMYNVAPNTGDAIINNLPGANPELYTQSAMSTLISPAFGQYFMTVSLFLFCFTTLITYFYKMDTNIAFIKEMLNIEKSSGIIKHAARFGLLGMVIFGAVNPAALIWAITDLGVGLLGWVNVITILLLSKTALVALSDYDSQKRIGLNPTFNPVQLGIKNADFWENEATKTAKTPSTGKTAAAARNKQERLLPYHESVSK